MMQYTIQYTNIRVQIYLCEPHGRNINHTNTNARQFELRT